MRALISHIVIHICFRQSRWQWQTDLMLSMRALRIVKNRIEDVDVMQVEETAHMLDMDAAAEKIISIDKYKAV